MKYPTSELEEKSIKVMGRELRRFFMKEQKT